MNSEAQSIKRRHFQSHVVFGIDSEPLSTCVAGNKLLISTLGHSIEVRDLDDYGSLSHSFCTVDLVKQMVFSDIGKYVATLEVKTSRLSLTTHVRLYFNWHMELNGVPMRARIAGRVTPSSQSNLGQLEMVELPLRMQTSHVNCCKSTANLAVACGRCVSLYRFCVKVHPISKLQFQDMEHMLDIYMTFPVKEVALCEEYAALMSSFEVQVIKLVGTETKDKKPNGETKSCLSPCNLGKSKYVTDDEYLINLADPIDSQLSKLEVGSTTVVLPSLQDCSHNDSDRYKGPRIIMGPLDYFAGLPTKIDAIISSFKSLKAVNLLYQKFPSILPTNSTPYFCLHSLQFLPFYINSASNQTDSMNQSDEIYAQSFHSPRRRNLRRLEIFFSGQNDGYLYDVSDKVHLVSAFNYQSKAYHVSVEHTVLHVVGANGVFTYSVGNWNRVIQHFSPDNPEKEPNIHNFNLQNVLLGFHPFVGVQLATFGEGLLVLLANNEENESQKSDLCWTTYALQCPLAEDIYTNFLDDECLCADENISEEEWYLLHDAHSALAVEVLLYNPPPSSRLFRLFQEASCQLGNIYLKFDSWSAISYFGMSGGSMNNRIEQILKRANTENEHEKYKICLALSFVFLKNSFEASEDLTEEIANSVLRLFSEHEPTLLSALILKRIFRGYDSNLAASLLLNRLQERKCNCVEDSLAACICCVSSGRMACLPNLLVALSDESLVALVNKYPHVWVNESKDISTTLQFTPLIQVVQQLKPELFVQILFQLFASEIVDPVIVVRQLCQSDCWEDFGLSSKNQSIHLHILEEFVKRNYQCNEAVITLAILYLKDVYGDASIRLPKQTKPWRLFMPRHHWLNKLPPFKGRSISKERCTLKFCESGTNYKISVRNCSCSSCNNGLVRLQSLLCSKAANAEVKQKVLEILEEMPKVNEETKVSLRVLCSVSILEGVRQLVSTFPDAIVEYCVDNVDKNEIQKWREIVDMWSESFDKDENKIVDGIISHLAEFLSPVELANLFPNERFTAQLVRSINKYQAKQIHNLIVAEGNGMTRA